MKKINIATVFSGIGSVEHALHRLDIPHNIVFACDIDKYRLIKLKARVLHWTK